MNQPAKITTDQFAIELLPAQAYEAQFTANRMIIGLALDDQSGVHAIASSNRKPFRRRANSLAVTPAGCDIYSASKTGGEYVTITLLDTDNPLQNGNVPTCNHPISDRLDTRACAIAQRARKAVLQSIAHPPINQSRPARINTHAHTPVSQLEIEHIAYDAINLASTSCEMPAHALTYARRRKLQDYINANLSQQMSVRSLAALVHLSPRYFSQIFLDGIGQTPHDYIVGRRLSAARILLQGKTPLTSIAAQTGFASQSHMAHTFRRRLGVSPSTYRKVMRD